MLGLFDHLIEKPSRTTKIKNFGRPLGLADQIVYNLIGEPSPVVSHRIACNSMGDYRLGLFDHLIEKPSRMTKILTPQGGYFGHTLEPKADSK